jgi:hypothetical protein
MTLEVSCVPLASPIPPTATIIPPTQTPAPLLGELIRIEKGGFALQPVLGYKLRRTSDYALISDDTEKVLINLVTTPSNDLTVTDILAFALSSFGLTQTTELEEYTLNGVDGLRVEVKTNGFFDGATGEVIILTPAENRYFTAVVIAGDSGIGWDPKAKMLFNAVLNTIIFFEPAK